MTSVRFEDWAASRSGRADPLLSSSNRAPMSMADLQSSKYTPSRSTPYKSSQPNLSSNKLTSELKELEQRLEESRLRSIQRQKELNEYKLEGNKHEAPHESIASTSYTSTSKYATKSSKSVADDHSESSSEDEANSYIASPSRKKITETTTTTTFSHGGLSSSSLDENEVLRQRLLEKTREVDRVRSDLDRALQQLREKEGQLQHSEGISSKRATELRLAHEKVDDVQRENATLRARLTDRDEVIETMKKSMAHMDSRLLALHRDLENAERIIDEARADSDKLEHDLDFKLSILEQSKFALANELESANSELREKNAEIARLLSQIKQQDEQVGHAQVEIQSKSDELHYKLQEIERWESEVAKLRRELEEERERTAALIANYEAFKSSARTQLHQLQSDLSAAELERSSIASMKVELVHDVNRLNRQLAERESQLQKTTRILEQKEQDIAELAPLAKEAKRTARMVMSESTFSASTPSKRWK